MKKIIRMVMGIAAAVILLTAYSMTVYATPPLMAGLTRSNFEKIKIANMGIWGQKYDSGEAVTVPLKFGYYMGEHLKETVDFSGTAYLLFSYEKEDGTVCQELKEIDVSGEEFELKEKSLKRKNGRLKGNVECTVDIPFDEMADTGEIEVAAGLWYDELEDGTYELLALDNTSFSSDTWRHALYPAEEHDWDEYRTSFYYIKTTDGVLIYKRQTPFISARLYFVEKMRDFTLYEEGDYDE